MLMTRTRSAVAHSVLLLKHVLIFEYNFESSSKKKRFKVPYPVFLLRASHMPRPRPSKIHTEREPDAAFVLPRSPESQQLYDSAAIISVFDR